MTSHMTQTTRNTLLQRLKKSTAVEAPISPIVARPSERYQPFPLNDMQQAYWLGRSSSLQDGDMAMHLYLEFVSPVLDRDRLQRAVDQLIARHDMLRAVVVDDETQQVLAEPGQLVVEEQDWRTVSDDRRQQQHVALRQDMAHRKANLLHWPQHRIVISRWPDRGCRLHLSLDLWCVDGRSYQLLLGELSTLYADGNDKALPELTLRFRDYQLYKESLKQSPEVVRTREYWQRRLEHMPPAPLPPLNPEPTGQSRFKRYLVELTPEKTRVFDARAREYGVTATSVLMTLYALVLGRWSGNNRFCLNIPRFNRPAVHPQINQVIGEFATFSLLEVNLDPQLSLVDQIRRLQQQLLTDMEHDQISGVELLRMLTRSQGSVANMPFVFTAAPELGQEQQSFEESISVLGKVDQALSQTPQVWLDCQYYRLNDALHANWDGLEGHFMPEVLESMFACFSEMLERLCDEQCDWEARWSLPLADDTVALWQQFNDTDRDVPPLNWHTRLSELALQQPNHVALMTGDGDNAINYQQLLIRLTRASGWLQQHADLQRPVAIWMNKSPSQILAAISVVLAGGCYLPLDPESPDSRVKAVLDRADVQWLIVDEHGSAANLDGGAVRQIDWQTLQQTGGAFTPVMAEPDANAYMIFTSGSTGRPKGVPIRHESLSNFVDFNHRHFNLCAQDRIYALSAMHHDMSIFDVFSGLHAGATLVVPNESERRCPETWLQHVQAREISVWNGVPAAGELLMNEALAAGQQITHLRQMIQGGDWVRPSLVARVNQIAPQCRFDSIGGPTEVTVWNITHRADGDYPFWNSVPYGRPAQNSQYYILDNQLALCPPWVTGEMFCRGAGVTRGYLNNDALNSQAFIDHPQFGRLYRTGDCGRLRPCGHIEFVGRRDNQVKLNGHRIELGELEQLALSVDGVVQAIALLIDDQRHSWLGLAYELRHDNDQGHEQLRQRFAAQLPAALLPRQWLSMDTWPLTGNQKIDREALIQDLIKEGNQRIRRAPANAIEQWLAELWEQAASITASYADDNFFLCGADSISATRLLGLIEEAFSVTLSIAQIFTSPTLEQQAALIEQQLLALSTPAQAASEMEAVL